MRLIALAQIIPLNAPFQSIFLTSIKHSPLGMASIELIFVLNLLISIPREGLIGQYDYAFLFKPNLPFMKKARRAAPFFGLNDRMPVVLALLLGLQHSLSMLAGM
jgi:hypothetical protein